MTDPLANPEMTDPSEGEPQPTAEELGIISPVELAQYLSRVFQDPEASSFERTQAAVGLASFWAGTEIHHLTERISE